MRGSVAGLPALLLIVTACGAMQDALVTVDDDPIPLPADIEERFLSGLPARGLHLEAIHPADGPPPISAERAIEIAGEVFNADILAGNNVPLQDVAVPDGLIRRLRVQPEDGVRESVWLVFYEWDAGFDCLGDGGGPGPCDMWSILYVDDRTGAIADYESLASDPRDQP